MCVATQVEIMDKLYLGRQSRQELIVMLPFQKELPKWRFKQSNRMVETFIIDFGILSGSMELASKSKISGLLGLVGDLRESRDNLSLPH